jgi:hypothetical protein
MENKEVEILKLGSILPVSPIKGTRVYDTSQFRKQTLMIVSDGGSLFDYYISILRKNCESDYNFLKTKKSIVGTPQIFRSSLLGHKPVDTLKGISDGDPIVGLPYTINNGSWYTSKIEKIIDDYILITKNSVYAIHNISDFRDKKLNDIGIE